MKPLYWIFICIICLAPSVAAQEQTIYLTAALPDDLGLIDAVLADFKADYPQVEVIRVNPVLPNAAADMEDYFKDFEAYASSADVLYLPSYALAPEAATAGFLLNLAPLTALDGDQVNFHRAAWESFQWDQGLWALPINFSLGILSYDPAVFDAAGLSYPTDRWSLAEIAVAVQYVGPLNVANASASLLRSLRGENLFTEGTSFNIPHLSTEPSIALFEAWQSAVVQQAISTIPLGEGQRSNWSITSPDNAYAMTLLPGGHAAMLHVNGAAVSAGTQHPELAYALAKYLTTRPELNAIYGDNVIPARHNGSYVSDGSFVSQAIDNALSIADLRYFDYFLEVAVNSTDALTAMSSAETVALAAHDAALRYRETLILSVNKPSIPVTPPAGEIVMRFGMFTPITPIPNQAQWDSVASEFADRDLHVSHIEFSTFANLTTETLLQNNYDCFFAPFAPSIFNTGVLLDLTPLVNADPDFVPDDFLFGVLDAASVEQRIFSYPLTFRPGLLSVRNSSSLPIPDSDWTFNEFVTVLNTSTEQPALGTNNVVATHLLLLIAANGGVPIDYRTEPPTLNFSGSIDAIRDVLDLAHSGHIFYRPQWVQGVAPLGPSFAPIMTVTAETFFVDPEVTYILYPRGQEYQPITFGIGAGYILRTAQNPEACYRWLSTISTRPDLFMAAMPVRHSALTSSLLLAAQGERLVSYYNEIASRLERPETILFPSALYGSGTTESFHLEEILYRAFDQYVRDNVDLAAVLLEAEEEARRYLSCTNAIASVNEEQDFNEYIRQYEQCMASARG